MAKSWSTPPREALRVRAGFDLAKADLAATPGWEHGETAAEKRLQKDGEHLSELQERLYADGRSDGTRSVLLVLQGMDTSGKGGIVRHVLGMVDPQGVQLRSFGVPTEKERSQHYLQRIREALPAPGRIGVFDRSHYEDVLVVRVNELVPQEVWEPRYDEINAFEREVVDAGTTLVKVALLVSPQEQKARLRERLERPDKYWKFNPGDIDERAKWPLYQEAYQAVLDRTSTEHAPWYAVPADNKWYAQLVVGRLLRGALEDLQLEWPAADFDIEAEKARLDAQTL
ncbi:polyphosphate kinase 2 family protein [Cellulomonas humilata]|uniref:Polyphosphate kinase 2 family protein n=1 Tax=Cellulomonas humilata TaxID=144055 RepID=A0A7Y5ZYL2_9CELL|nr:PPK2 family polyphosphate kinase [Cellulomonas humilata]NUU16514.1 polyphosphate kinase 2 family protein [Cellulomonas humilata]